MATTIATEETGEFCTTVDPVVRTASLLSQLKSLAANVSRPSGCTTVDPVVRTASLLSQLKSLAANVSRPSGRRLAVS